MRRRIAEENKQAVKRLVITPPPQKAAVKAEFRSTQSDSFFFVVARSKDVGRK